MDEEYYEKTKAVNKQTSQYSHLVPITMFFTTLYVLYDGVPTKAKRFHLSNILGRCLPVADDISLPLPGTSSFNSPFSLDEYDT